MSLLAASVAVTHLFPASADVPFDDKGYITENPILAPTKELVIASLASLIVFGLLWKYAWPSIKKSFNDRTAGIQKELDDSSAAKVTAEAEAASIRQAQGDIEAERTRLHAEAEAQAEALITDGRLRIEAEMAELEARADADIAAAAGRSSDELRSEIARHSGVAIERIVEETLDDATHQALIEGFIQRVGASTGASS
jgi:F-type H+-transporting ATPase subunit b